MVSVGVGKDFPKHRCADPVSLVRGKNIKMIEQPVVLLRSDEDEADTNATGFDEPTQRRIERGQKALAGSLRIETADTFQAFTHCGNADIDKGVRVGLCSGGELDGHGQRQLKKERVGGPSSIAGILFLPFPRWRPS